MRCSAFVIATCLATAPGCSFALDGPDPARPRGERPSCSTEKSAVILDGLVGTVLGVVAIALAADGEPIAAVPALGGATYLYAAISGNTKVNECNTALARFGTEVNPGEMGPERARDLDADELVAGTDEDRPRTASRPPPSAIDRPDGMTGSAAPPPGSITTPPVQPPPAPQPPAPRPADVEETWAEFWKVVVP